MELKVLGIDVSKSSVTCCLLDSYPKGGLLTYWNKTRNKAAQTYPAFFSDPNPKRKQKSAFDFASYVVDNQPTLAIMEPTGNHYSRLWATILQALGIKILWVGHIQLRRYRGGKNLPNKSDAADALAMAAYPLDSEHQTEDGEIDLKHFLMHQPESINQVRELCQQIEHLARVQSPIINYARQCLAWQFPEVAHAESKTSVAGNLPPLWGWLAQKSDRLSKKGITQMEKKRESSIAVAYGIEITDFTRLHAAWLCDIFDWEAAIDADIRQLLAAEEFRPYNEIFTKLGFGLRTRARLLSRIYPFESFLTEEGKVWIEYEVREVKKVERYRANGETVIKRDVGDVKRVKRNRSRDAFKMRLGMGTVLEQSGDSLVEKPSGSSICRQSFWQHVLCQVETGKLPVTTEAQTILDYRDSLKSKTNDNGQKLLDGKHVQGKLMSKVANIMFSMLVQAIAKR